MNDIPPNIWARKKPKVQFPVRLCTTCNRVWEHSYDMNHRKTISFYHRDFPTYGLKRSECSGCTV